MSAAGSRDDVFDDMAGDIGQAIVTAVVAVGELFVIEPEHVEDGGVEVVDVDLILSDADAAVVGGAVDGATFDAGAGHPVSEGVRVVIAPGIGSFL